jgi:hypothetical protein
MLIILHCVNKILSTPAIFPFSTGEADAVGAMDGVHSYRRYREYISEYYFRCAGH